MHGSLALKLRVLRAERALTIEQAAERAGVTPETISDAERGRRHPYLPTLQKLAAAYEVPVEELLSAEEPVPLAEAPREAGRPSIIDVAWDAARRQVALEKRGDEIAGTQNIVDQRHENEGARRLREEHGLDGNNAEALVDFALKCVRLEEKNTTLEEKNTTLEEEIAMLRDRLQEREQTHS